MNKRLLLSFRYVIIDVYLPANFGVSSPHLTAANAWANSCKGKIIKIAKKLARYNVHFSKNISITHIILEFSIKRKYYSRSIFRIFYPVDFNRCNVLHIDAFAAIIAHFQRVKVAHFAFSAIYTIAIVQNALFSFPFFCFHNTFIISLIFENFNKK